jgi:hypothetical protein
MTMSILRNILGFSVKFFFQLIYTDYTNLTYFDKRSHLIFFLWNCSTKLIKQKLITKEISILVTAAILNGGRGCHSQICFNLVEQFQRKKIKCEWVYYEIFWVFLWNFSFNWFIPIIQIWHILIKDHILFFSSEIAEPN